MLLVSAGVHGEFEGLQAVVVGKICHEGGERPWRGSGVGQDLSQIGLSGAIGTLGPDDLRDVYI